MPDIFERSLAFPYPALILSLVVLSFSLSCYVDAGRVNDDPLWARKSGWSWRCRVWGSYPNRLVDGRQEGKNTVCVCKDEEAAIGCALMTDDDEERRVEDEWMDGVMR
jgi:hypothetical protein